MTTVHAVLVKHLDAFQNDSGEVESRLRLTQTDLKELSLSNQLSDLSVEGNDKKTVGSSSVESKQVSESLLACIDCILVATESSPSDDGLLELIAAIAAEYNGVMDEIIEIAEKASCAALDRIRVIGCRLVAACASACVDDNASSISLALLPRLMDKAQAVRYAALIACASLNDNDEITEALLWSLHHDPSLTNRCAALASLQIGKDNVDHVIRRLRDVKSKVRVAAVEKLHHISLEELSSAQCATIIRAGLTDRCKETSDATTVLLCTRWIKTAKYEPLTLLSFLNPSVYEPECEKVITTLLQVTAESNAVKDLSDAEVRAFRQGMTTLPPTELRPANLMVARLQCQRESSSVKKADLLSKIVPDIPMLCDAIQKCVDTLVEDPQEETEVLPIDEEAHLFCCNQLFKIAQLMDLQEEGSKRHFVTACKALLSSTQTPEELLEEAIKAMSKAYDREDDFLQAVAEIVEQMDAQLRVVSILTLCLEHTSPRMATHSALKGFVKHVVPAVTNDDTMIREAGVGCLGRLALLSEEATVIADFKPLFLRIISKAEEKMEIRAQAMLALSDLSMLFDNILVPIELDGEEVGFVAFVSDMLQNENPSVVAVASEVATKLLFSGKVQDKHLVAALLVVFFSKNDYNEDDDDVQEVGSVYRMQQLLSLFFPAYGLKGNLVEAIGPMLSATAIKKRGRKAFPIAKMIEFVYSNAEGIEDKKEGETDKTTSNALLVCLEISTFLVQNNDQLTNTNLRTLCKLLGGADVDIENSSTKTLMELKETVNELGMHITDEASLESLETMMELLEDVEAAPHDSEETESEDENDLADAMGAVTLEVDDSEETESEDENDENVMGTARQEGKADDDILTTTRSALAEVN